MNTTTSRWWQPTLLLSGIGISSLGDWIYLIAINLLVLQMTESPLAVAGLYLIKPIAGMLTGLWAGSLIDRLDKRRLMIGLDIARALLIVTIPFMPNIWAVYGVTFVLGVASHIFMPTSMTYVTLLVPSEQRKRFNSIHHLLTSGAFIVGPALAGVLLLMGPIDVAIFINAGSFLIAAFILYLLPSLSATSDDETIGTRFSLQTIVSDWSRVGIFVRKAPYVVWIYALFQLTFVIALGLDSQEVVFSQQVLSLSDSEYGLLVSLTGIGYLAGSILNSAIVHLLSLRLLLGVGTFMTAVGYVLFSISTSFMTAILSFMLLAFFMAFANTGMTTFYQQHVPTQIMGRFGSVMGTCLAVVQIASTLGIGLAGEISSVRVVFIIWSIIMLLVTIVLAILTFQRKKASYYEEASSMNG